MAWERTIPVGMCDATYILQLTGATKPSSITMSHDPEAAIDVGLANSLHQSFATHMIPALAQAYTFQGVHILGRQDASNLVAADSTSPDVVGTRAATLATAMTSPQISALVRKTTAFAGKAQRGRFYWPGVAENDVDHIGKLTGAAVSAFQTAVQSWFANLVTFAKPMLAHSCFHEDDQPPCVPLPWTVVTSFEVDDVVSTQRRRLVR